MIDILLWHVLPFILGYLGWKWWKAAIVSVVINTLWMESWTKDPALATYPYFAIPFVFAFASFFAYLGGWVRKRWG